MVKATACARCVKNRRSVCFPHETCWLLKENASIIDDGFWTLKKPWVKWGYALPCVLWKCERRREICRYHSSFSRFLFSLKDNILLCRSIMISKDIDILFLLNSCAHILEILFPGKPSWIKNLSHQKSFQILPSTIAKQISWTIKKNLASTTQCNQRSLSTKILKSGISNPDSLLGKKTYNLVIRDHPKSGLSSPYFREWRSKLRKTCESRFEDKSITNIVANQISTCAPDLFMFITNKDDSTKNSTARSWLFQYQDNIPGCWLPLSSGQQMRGIARCHLYFSEKR